MLVESLVIALSFVLSYTDCRSFIDFDAPLPAWLTTRRGVGQLVAKKEWLVEASPGKSVACICASPAIESALWCDSDDPTET
eukprot:scaffold197322_cov28-Tisochrysis_lutea.AAC.1